MVTRSSLSVQGGAAVEGETEDSLDAVIHVIRNSDDKVARGVA